MTVFPTGIRQRGVSFALLFCGVITLMVAAVYSAPNFPKLTGRVVDTANLLSATTRQNITAQLEGHENASSNQVVVATVNDMQGYPIEEYANLLFRHWGVGQQDKNNGTLLLIAKNERKVRIEVGYGLEGVLTDAISKSIIESDILPHFKQGNFDTGISAGASAIVSALGGEYQVRSNKKSGSKRLLPMFLFIFFVVVLQVRRAFGRGRRGLMGSMMGGTIIGSGHSRGGSFGGGGFGGGGGSSGGGGASGGW